VKYRRALLHAELGADLGALLPCLAALAPELEHLLVVLSLPQRAWRSGEASPGDEAAIEAMRARASALSAQVRVELAPEPTARALGELVAQSGVDLIVAGTRSLRSARLMNEVRRRNAVAMLWPEGRAPSAVKELFCVALGPGARPAIRAFLREHGDPSMHVTLLASPLAGPIDDVDAIREIAGIEATVELVEDASIRRWLRSPAPDRALDLFAFPRMPSALLAGVRWPAPVLVLPPPRPRIARAIDVADLVADRSEIRARVDYAIAVGDLPPAHGVPIALAAGGEIVASGTTSSAGELTFPDVAASRVGVLRSSDPAAIEEHVRVVRPGERSIVVFDAAVSDGALRSLRALDADVLAVRMRPTRSCRSIRARLRRAQLEGVVIDARAVLDEGEALDVSEELDAVRLARAASRLRRMGFDVVALVHRSVNATPLSFPSASELAIETLDARGPRPEPDERSSGNRVEIELDNALARRWLLETIGGATRSVHLQVYMAHDDAVGRAVESALADAGKRGVAVRVLIDSLHGLHGSFGVENPLLARMGSHAGVELLISRPITELPSLTDLKQRDHRKLVVVDGRVALVGGRNLGREYYTGWGEVPITAQSMWREVPWLDAGARIEGPAVGALEVSFRDAWIEAKSAAFEASEAPPIAGASDVRVVVHRGLRDAKMLETYLELIGSARSHVDVANGFPMMLELQHALLGALRRGVRVRALIGHVTPTHGGLPFEGPWASARRAATELVQSRMDALVEAGAGVYAFGVGGVEGWDRELGVVHPHVHAKVMSVDGERCAVGSANLDVTSAYWESELSIVIEDPVVAQALEAKIDALVSSSAPIERGDPARRMRAAMRAWMRHWPGVLSF
jgi:cardiolipin synthase